MRALQHGAPCPNRLIAQGDYMERRRAILIGALLWAFLLVLEAGEKRWDIEANLSVKSVGNIAWTTDGKSVVFSIQEWLPKDNRRVSHLYRVDADGGEPQQLTRGERGERSPSLSPDGRYLAFLAAREPKKGTQIWILPLNGGEAYQLTEAEHGAGAFAWSPDSSRIAYVTRDVHADKEEREKRKKDKFDAVVVDRDFSWTHLWSIGLKEREPMRITEGEFNAASPSWSADGKQIAFQANYVPFQPSPWKHIDDNLGIDIFLVSSQGGETTNLTPGPGRAQSPRWSPKGRRLSYSATAEEHFGETYDLYIYDADSGRTANLSQGDQHSVQGGGVWSPDGKTLYYSQGRGVYTWLYRISASGGKAQRISDEHGISFGAAAVSPDGKRLAYSDNDPSKPSDIHISATDGSGSRALTNVNPQITDYALADSRPIRWKSTDGLEIEGLLTLPTAYRQGQRYPMVLQIHGGPTGRFTHSFNSRSTQYWAARGYAILQPNPRGSTGYGRDFIWANQSDWGGKDFHADDLSGVDKVIEMGIADPDRLVVMGGSYGGFSTFWAVARTDRFKAAIGHAAISDWYSFYGQTDIPQYLKWGFEGHAWDRAEVYRKFSPFEYVKNVKTPLMITHGEEDRRVPISQAEQYYTALKKLGVEVEFVRYPREGHGIREPNHQIDLMKRQLAWFDRHLGIVRESDEAEKVETQPQSH